MVKTALRKKGDGKVWVAGFPLPEWLLGDERAEEIVASLGRNVSTGLPVGEARVAKVSHPDREHEAGSVTVVNQLGGTAVIGVIELRDRFQRGQAFWWIGELPDVTTWRFQVSGGGNRWVTLVRGDPLFCTLDQTRVRFHRMVRGPGGLQDWSVEVTSNYDGRVLPDLRHPSQLFAYGA